MIDQRYEYDALPGFGDSKTISLAYSVLKHRMRNIESMKYRREEYNLLWYLGTAEQYNAVISYIKYLIYMLPDKDAS